VIEARGLVKHYGSTMAVNDLSFSIRPGMVTGFLGPNGAGQRSGDPEDVASGADDDLLPNRQGGGGERGGQS
jgi:ABC-type uncharacterized transport system ATPase subunit